MTTKAEYLAEYGAGLSVCPEHDADDQCMVGGVCWWCVCGCPLCEGDLSTEDR